MAHIQDVNHYVETVVFFCKNVMFGKSTSCFFLFFFFLPFDVLLSLIFATTSLFWESWKINN